MTNWREEWSKECEHVAEMEAKLTASEDRRRSLELTVSEQDEVIKELTIQGALDAAYIEAAHPGVLRDLIADLRAERSARQEAERRAQEATERAERRAADAVMYRLAARAWKELARRHRDGEQGAAAEVERLHGRCTKYRKSLDEAERRFAEAEAGAATLREKIATVAKCAACLLEEVTRLRARENCGAEREEECRMPGGAECRACAMVEVDYAEAEVARLRARVAELERDVSAFALAGKGVATLTVRYLGYKLVPADDDAPPESGEAPAPAPPEPRLCGESWTTDGQAYHCVTPRPCPLHGGEQP